MRPIEVINQPDVSRPTGPHRSSVSAKNSVAYLMSHRIAYLVLCILLITVALKVSRPDVAAAANEITVEFATK